MADDTEQKPIPQQPRREISRRPVVVGLIGLVIAEAVAGGINWKVLSQRLYKLAPAVAPPVPTIETVKTAQPFTETFQNNQRGWQQDSSNGITPKIAKNAYTLSVANSDNTYFLLPNTAKVGMLPANFTLTARMAQQQGDASAFYGLAFRLALAQGSDMVSGYVFAINGNGICALLKYNSHKSGSPTVLQDLLSVFAIHKNVANTLQVTVRGSHFSFKINGTAIVFTGASSHSITDTSYAGGQLSLMVSGPDTTFIVTSVQLSVP